MWQDLPVTRALALLRDGADIYAGAREEKLGSAYDF